MDPVKREQIVMTLRMCNHTSDVDINDWYKVNDNLVILAGYTLVYCKENYLPLKFTSIIRPQIKGVSKSKTHEQGRAFDMSVVGWKLDEIKRFVKRINNEFKLGAVSMSDGAEREAVYEDGITRGTGPHLHVQCRP